MSSIMEQIKPEHPELFALEFGKIAETDFVYTLSSPNINQSAPSLVKMFLRTKSVTKKEMNKCMAEIYDPGGFRTRAARLISQYHNHFLYHSLHHYTM